MEKEENKNSAANFDSANSRGAAHLSDAEIIAYQYGNFSSDEAELRAQNHLIECRRCTNLLLELSDFAESTAAASASVVENTDVQWARFESKRLAESNSADQIATTTKVEPAAESRRGFFDFLSFNFATVAAFGMLLVLAGAAVFLALRNAEINESSIASKSPPTAESAAVQKNIETAERESASENTNSDASLNRQPINRSNQDSSPAPRPKTKNQPKDKIIDRSFPVPEKNKTAARQDELALNTAEFELYPNEVLRGASDRRKIRVKDNIAGQIRLKLNAPKAKNLSAFSIEILDSENRAVLTLPLLPDKSGNFLLIIPRKKLPADVYSLKLYAEENNRKKLFSEYEFELEYN